MLKTTVNYFKTYLAYIIIVFVLMFLIKQLIVFSFPTISFTPLNETPTLTAEIQMQELKKQIAAQEQLTFARAVENTAFDFKNYLFSQASYVLKNKEGKKLVIFYGRLPVCEGSEIIYRGANMVYDFDEKKPKYLELFNYHIELGCDVPTAFAQTGVLEDEIKFKCLAFDPDPMWMFRTVNKTFLVDFKTCKLKPIKQS